MPDPSQPQQQQPQGGTDFLSTVAPFLPLLLGGLAGINKRGLGGVPAGLALGGAMSLGAQGKGQLEAQRIQELQQQHAMQQQNIQSEMRTREETLRLHQQEQEQMGPVHRAQAEHLGAETEQSKAATSHSQAETALLQPTGTDWAQPFRADGKKWGIFVPDPEQAKKMTAAEADKFRTDFQKGVLEARKLPSEIAAKEAEANFRRAAAEHQRAQTEKVKYETGVAQGKPDTVKFDKALRAWGQAMLKHKEGQPLVLPEGIDPDTAATLQSFSKTGGPFKGFEQDQIEKLGALYNMEPEHAMKEAQRTIKSSLLPIKINETPKPGPGTPAPAAGTTPKPAGGKAQFRFNIQTGRIEPNA